MTKSEQIKQLWAELPNSTRKTTLIAEKVGCSVPYVSQVVSGVQRGPSKAVVDTIIKRAKQARQRRVSGAYNWNAKGRVEYLAELIEKNGLSSSQLALALTVKFGEPLTRNAVIGKLNRLGIALGQKCGPRVVAERRGCSSPKVRRPRLNGVQKAAFQPKVNPIRKALDSIPVEPMPESRPEDIARVSFLELEKHHCRFVPFDPQEGHALTAKKYCGLNAEPGTPYCRDHLARCYQVISPSRRLSPANSNLTAPGAVMMDGGKREAVS